MYYTEDSAKSLCYDNNNNNKNTHLTALCPDGRTDEWTDKQLSKRSFISATQFCPLTK